MKIETTLDILLSLVNMAIVMKTKTSTMTLWGREGLIHCKGNVNDPASMEIAMEVPHKKIKIELSHEISLKMFVIF